MMKRININFLTKAVQAALLALSLNLVMFSSSSAADIICGTSKCDISQRQCVKFPHEVCKLWSSGGMAGGSVCLKYGPDYRCIGKKETAPKNSTIVTASVNDNGKTLSGDEEKKALLRAKDAAYTAFEKNEIVDTYYEGKDKVLLDKEAERLLNDAGKKEKEKETWPEQNDTQDVFDWVAKLEEYTTRAGYDKGLGSAGDSRILDASQAAIDNLDSLKNDGHISVEDYEKVKAAIGKVTNEALQRAQAAATYTKEEEKVEKAQEDIAEVKDSILQRCPTTEQYKARYGAGCWSCLVMERLTSSFLHAADKGLHITQKAGMVLLWLGTAIWLVLWALKNVSSFTQLQLGNILNDLFKFLFKVAFAYWFIVYSPTAISKYFITPIMGLGATIGQSFWASEIKDYTEDFVWEDEYVSEEDQKNVEAALSAANQPGGVQEETAPENAEDAKKAEEIANEPPQQVQPDEYEETVQQFQKALISVLQKYLKEIQNSCTDSPYISNSNPKCTQQGTNKCRHYAGCKDKGHRSYVRKIYSRAGSPLGEGAYCMMSITAALEEINEQVGGDITTFQTGKGFCLDGIKVGAQYENSAVVGANGGDVDLMEAIKYANVGDIVYIRVSGSVAGTVGSGSGYHATTHMGGGRLISFNGDGIYTSPASFIKNPVGKIIRVSEVIRQRLKKNPNAKINKKALASLAEGAGLAQSLVNYQGGTYTGLTNTDYNALIVSIPEVTYTGPTNIMPKSVMNSILGATRAITNTTANNMVLGNAIMCYSTIKDGGAWVFKLKGIEFGSAPNFIMWIEGAIIWSLGFMLTLAVAYYFLDISFKIGFAVLAIPLVMGLWPFGFTQGKLYIAISIIAKSAATFAFLAITTYFGMGLINESVSLSNMGGEDGLYQKLDKIASRASEADEEELREQINAMIYLFSPTFILLLFAIIYAFKLVQQTSSDLVNKFFPDKAFGDSSPMHSAATMMTSWTKNMAMKMSGADLAKDIIANQTGVLAKNMVKGAGKLTGQGLKATGHGIKQGAKATGRGIVAGFNKLRGK